MRHGDNELQALLTNSAPPADLQRVALFRSVCRKHEKKAGQRPCQICLESIIAFFCRFQVEEEKTLEAEKPFVSLIL